MDNPRLPYLSDKAHGLPLLPGVYIMKNKAGDIIYIGKAKALKNRVSSYFRSVEKHLPKVYRMVSQVFDFDYIVTDSEFEALVLECSMIKLHTPKYNILLKDDKGYSYIKIFPKEYSRIRQTFQREEDGAEYIGPYLSAYVVKETIDEANRVFLLPTCSKRFPQEFGKGRPCLNFHIKRCMGVCQGRISLEEYHEILAQALEYIKGGSSQSVELMTRQMNEYAENMQFEKAAQLRDRIRAIGKISESQKVVFTSVANQDVIALQRTDTETCAVVLKFRTERLVDKQDFLLGAVDDLDEARQEFLLRYYTTSNRQDLPRKIQLDGPVEDVEIVAQLLSEQAGYKVEIRIPQRGEQLKLMEMAKKNAAEKLSQRGQRTGREVAALDELARLLGLEKPPGYIESYDISNIGSDTVVAGMVVFENGRPLRKCYRKFSIKTVAGTDDYASMSEVLRRRFERYLDPDKQDEAFDRLPDLILLDGGKGHVGTCPCWQGWGFRCRCSVWSRTISTAPARSLKAAVKLQSPPTAVHLPSFPRFRRRCTGFRSSIPGRNTRRAHSPSRSPNAKGSATSALRKSTNSSKRSRRSGRLRSMSWRRSRGCPTRQRSGCTSFCMRKIDKSA